MLKEALKLDEVHTFGELSKSQLIEKVDTVTEKTYFFELMKSQNPNTRILITIISLASKGILHESDGKFGDAYEK